MMQLRWDIRTRVLVVALVPTAALGILLTIILTFSRLNDLEDAVVQRGEALARQLASASEFGLFSGDKENLTQLANSALNSTDLQGVSIFDRDHKLIAVAGLQANASTQNDTRDVELIGNNLLRIAAPVHPTRSASDDLFGQAEVSRQNNDANMGEVVVLLSMEPLQNRKRSQMIAAIVTLLGMLGASAALAGWMSRSVSQPIRNIAGAVSRIGQGHLDVRVPSIGTGGSLQLLAEGLNDMALRLSLARDELQDQIDKATAELRARKEEAEHANLAKSRFLAAASHDLRQPMHALGLFIAELADKQHSPETKQLIERISASAEAMEDLLDSLLDISKLDAGVVTANPRPFALGPLFRRIADDYASAAEEKGLKLRVRPTDLWIFSDPLLFERILFNLVTNALRYTPRGSVLIAARKRGTRVIIEVRDSGIGIPVEAQQSVFQEFVQLDNAARDRSKGLGLGLAIVRRLAILLDHQISLRSQPGRGSVFGVEARAAKASAQIVSESRDRPGLSGLVVAVIDDDSLAMESLSGLLRAWGCDVIPAESLDALKKALDQHGKRPGVLVSDFRLPGQYNGLQVIAALRKQFGPELPGLLLSGDTGPEVLRQATDLGVPLLHKPVRPAKLRAAISHLAGGASTDEMPN